MRRFSVALIFGSFLVAGLQAADQQLVNMVMPDAKVVAGINVMQARNSPFGTFVLRQMSGSPADLQKFVEATGFNPQTDLDEILIATPGAPEKPAEPPVAGAPVPVPTPGSSEGKSARSDMRGLILARGHFNIEKIAGFAKSDGKQNVQKYREATLVSDPKNPMASSMAFIGSDVMVAGDLVSVKAALDRRSLANSLEPQLATKVNSLSASQDAWAVSIAPFSSFSGATGGPAGDPMGPMGPMSALGGDLFKKITSTSGGIKFGPQIQLSTEMVAADEKNASALGDVVRFLVGMATMSSGPAKDAPAGLVAMLQGLTVKSEGNVVNLTITVPEEQLESLFNSMPQGMKRPGARI